MARMTPEDMMRAVSSSMKERTGRSLDEWLDIVRRSGIDPLDQNAVRRWLKTEHAVQQNTQYAIADAAARAAGWTPPGLEQYIDQQYAGTKQALRPIFDRLRAYMESLGDDVSVGGRETYTPFVRGRQFAAIAAATRTRVDVGLRYRDAPASALLTAATAPGQATHRLSLGSVDDITEEVTGLIRIAYEQNA